MFLIVLLKNILILFCILLKGKCNTQKYLRLITVFENILQHIVYISKVDIF